MRIGASMKELHFPCSVSRIEGTLQHYAWGGYCNIAEIERRPPSGLPEAERWYGTHPSGPAFIAGEELASLVKEHPSCAFGPASSRNDLPFLIKLLDAAQPLSLQVHPNLQQAQRGFERENSSAIPDSSRNYQDPYPKPEVIIALSDLWAVVGFRQPSEVARLIRDLRVVELEEEASLFASSKEGHKVIKSIFDSWMSGEHRSKLSALREACESYRGSSSATLKFVYVAQKISEAFPDDIGLLISLLLNCVKLSPGQALFTPANTLHAYIHGFGLEVMAPSDNVLRCAMTKKRRDLPELVQLVDFKPRYPEVFDPFRNGGFTAENWFQVQMFRGSVDLPQNGAQIVMVTRGTVMIDGSLYNAGDGIWLPHCAGPQSVDTANAEFAVISAPLEPN